MEAFAPWPNPSAFPDRVVWQAPALVDEMRAALDRAEATPSATEARRPSADAKIAAAADALVPRLRQWFGARANDETIHESIAAALRAAREASACSGVALLRTWCDGWNTANKRGLGQQCCIM